MTDKPLNPWQPTTDKIDLAHLGKLAEELGEASAAVARCIIQGIDECEPVTKKPNREWLEEELADVLAGIAKVIERFALDDERIGRRIAAKENHLSRWHDLLRGIPSNARTLVPSEDRPITPRTRS